MSEATDIGSGSKFGEVLRQTQLCNLFLESGPLLPVSRKNESGGWKLVNDCGRRGYQPRMPLNIRVHVPHQHDKFTLANSWEQLVAFVSTRLKSINVDSIMDYAQLFRLKSILSNQRVTYRCGVGQYCASQVLYAPQPPSALALVPVKVCQITPAGNNRPHSRQPRCRNSDQVRPQIMGVDDVEFLSPQEPAQPQQLVEPSGTVDSALGVKFTHGDLASLKSF